MIHLETGTALGFGGTHARSAQYVDGQMTDFDSEATPTTPQEFFKWMATRTLAASDDGSQWLVAGYPGPVSEDGKLIGPMANVAGMSKERFDLRKSLTAADPAIGRLLDEGFMLIGVNDGELAAQAVARRLGGHKYRVSALIIGTGQGAGVVQKGSTTATDGVFRSMPGAVAEIGHIPLSSDPRDSFENDISATALGRRHGIDPRDLPEGHPAWDEVGDKVVRLAAILGLMYGVELVAPTGGVGIGASHKYQAPMRSAIDTYMEYGNATQVGLMPEIVLIDPTESHEFEMHGAPNVVEDFATRPKL